MYHLVILVDMDKLIPLLFAESGWILQAPDINCVHALLAGIVLLDGKRDASGAASQWHFMLA